jgi:hypothetical protein
MMVAFRTSLFFPKKITQYISYNKTTVRETI